MKRLLLVIGLFSLLVASATAHDAPVDESPKKIHAVYVSGEECRTPQCSMSWISVVITAMDWKDGRKQMPDGYRISWKLKGKKWLKKGMNNRLNRGTAYFEHIPKPYAGFTDPHQGYHPLFITDQICVPFGTTMQVRVRPVYKGEKNGPWTKDSTTTGGSAWGQGWNLPKRNPTCPGDPPIGPVGNVDD